MTRPARQKLISASVLSRIAGAASAVLIAGGSACDPSAGPSPSLPADLDDLRHRSSPLLQGLRGEGLYLDPNGFEGRVCVGSECQTGSVPKRYDLGPGVYAVNSHESGPLVPGSGPLLGVITVDSSGAATLESPYFVAGTVAGSANAIKLRTTPITLNNLGYIGYFTFDFIRVWTTGFSTRLIADRRYSLFDIASGYKPVGASYALTPGGGDITIRSEGETSEVNGQVLQSFDWDAASNTLTARVQEVTLDFRGYGGAVGFGDQPGMYKHRPPSGIATYILLKNRYYGMLDFLSTNPATDWYGFTTTSGVHVGADGALTLAEDLLPYFQLIGSSALQAVVTSVTATTTGYFYTGVPGLQLGGPGTVSSDVIPGRRYGLAPNGVYWQVSFDGSISPSDFDLTWGGTLHLEGTPVAPPPAAEPVAALPQACIIPRGENAFDVMFTYRNKTSADVSIPVGETNQVFSPANAAFDPGQNQLFTSGVHGFVVSSDPEGSPVTWRLGDLQTTATRGGPAPTPTCTSAEEQQTPCWSVRCAGDVACVPVARETCDTATDGCITGTPGQAPIACGTPFPITIDATDLGPGTFDLVRTFPDSEEIAWRVTLAQTSAQTINLRPMVHLEYPVVYRFVSQTHPDLTTEFAIDGETGTIVTQDVPFKFDGNGKTTLRILQPRVYAAFDWEMEERLTLGYPGFLQPDGAEPPDSEYLFEAPDPDLDPARERPLHADPASWNVYLDACGSHAPGGTITGYRWLISQPSGPRGGGGLGSGDSGELPPLPRIEASTECRKKVPFSHLGDYDVVTEVTRDGGLVASTRTRMTLKDYLVVSMGDSYASGEGNPIMTLLDTGDIQEWNWLEWLYFTWDDARRRLSRWSAHAQAALMLERSDPHTSVTFISTAQTGASIAEGILGPMAPAQRPTRGFPENVAQVMPQIEWVQSYLGQCQDDFDGIYHHPLNCVFPRPIDYLMLSIGGNDISFGNIIETCAAPTTIAYDLSTVGGPQGTAIMENCAATIDFSQGGPPQMIPYAAPGWTGNGWTAKIDRMMEALDDVKPAHPGDTAGYAHLNKRLHDARLITDGATKVLISTYPDPTVADAATGQLCSEFVLKNAAGKLNTLHAVEFAALLAGPTAGLSVLSIPIAWGGCASGDARNAERCDDGIINANEVLWAREKIVSRLNNIIASTTDLGWKPLIDIPAEFAGHGYCGSSNFIVTYENSWETQGTPAGFLPGTCKTDGTGECTGMKGTMHPNRAGEEVIGRHFAKEMGVTDVGMTAQPGIYRTSTGQPDALCPANQGVVGVSCFGRYCGGLDSMCKPLPRGVTESGQTVVDQASEEEGPRDCGPSGFLMGLGCVSSNCDAVRYHCGQLVSAQATNCVWTEQVSEETRWNVFQSGKFANGFQCLGDFCDALKFRVCDLIPTPGPGEAHLKHPRP